MHTTYSICSYKTKRYNLGYFINQAKSGRFQSIRKFICNNIGGVQNDTKSQADSVLQFEQNLSRVEFKDGEARESR